MPFDDIINPNQGAIKSSEIFMDRSLEIIKNSIGETTLKTLEGMMKPIADAIRYNNFLLHSDGQIVWETNLSQPRIRFNADAKANNIRLRLMMLDESAQSRTVDIIIPATVGANSLTGFNTINMNNNDLIYMELSRSVILAAISGTPASTPAVITLENGIDGGSVTSGRRLLKVNMTGNTGMPAMVADLDSILQDASQTVNIPIAARYDWTDNIDTYSDIWWIPHGIRWPTGSISVVGAVVVSGFNALPNYFARTITEFNQQLALLTTTGGMIAIIAPITINSPITIPDGVTIIGRTKKNHNTSPGLYFSSGGKFILGNRSAVKDLYIRGLAGFGQVAAEHILEVASTGVEISGNLIEFVSNTSTQGRAINLLTGAQDFKINNNAFSSIVAATRAVQYSAATYTRANLYANQFTTITEAVHATISTAMQVNNSYGVVPVGTILPWVGAAMINGANSTPTRLVASMAALAAALPEGWVICDGRSLPTDSTLRQGGATFTPNLTDLYLLGSNSLASGVQAGNNSYTINNAVAPFNVTNVASNGNSSGNYSLAAHTHSYRHVHQWSAYVDPNFRTYPTAPIGLNMNGNIQANNNTPITWAFASRLDGSNGGGAEMVRGYTNPNYYTGAPIKAGQNAPTAVGGSSDFTSTNNDGSGGSFNGTASTSWSSSVLNNLQGGHGHSLTSSIFPTYLRSIYIMRYK